MNIKRTPSAILAVLGLLCFTSIAHAQSPILVDDDSTAMMPDGSTWSNAYSDLQEGINAASSGQEVWVARGEYLPTGGTPSRASTIQLKNGVIVRGGYNGLEFPGDENTRVLDPSLTVISGDLAGNDGSTIPPDPFADNVFVVITAGDGGLDIVEDDTVLDYLTIRGGNGENSGGTSNGGAGMTINANSNPTIQNCIIEGNQAPDELEGGGVAIKTGDNALTVTMENCIIRSNRGGKGGGIAVLNGSRLFMTGNQSEIRDNVLNEIIDATVSPEPPVFGAGFYIDASSEGEFRNVTIADNTWENTSDDFPPAFGGGGASLGTLLMKDCVLDNNVLGNLGPAFEEAVPVGGGLYVDGSAQIANCLFVSNDVVAKFNPLGGGMALGVNADVTMSNCTLRSNAAGNANFGGVGLGGAIYVEGDLINDIFGKLMVTNTLMANNTAFGKGGAVYSLSPLTDFFNCTVANNSVLNPSSGGDGGGLFLRYVITDPPGFADCIPTVDEDCTPDVVNCIVWGNRDTSGNPTRDEQILIGGTGTEPTIVTFSCIEDEPGTPGIPFNDLTVTSNIEGDPKFVDEDGPDNTAGNADDNFRLAADSAATDVGSNSAVPPDALDVDEDTLVGEDTPDLDLQVRIALNTTTGSGPCGGSIVDMGAYERQALCTDNIAGDLNDDGSVDGLDIQPFVDCFLTTPVGSQDCDCVRGDYVGADGVRENDIPAFVACLLSAGSGCPVPTICGDDGPQRLGLQDCNLNEINDEVDILNCDPAVDPENCDCNRNGIPDGCDIDFMTSADLNNNDTPDECEPDCNSNSIPDDKDIADATSADCDSNGVPDECDEDCNGNSTPDACETMVDCNSNGIFDACELDCDNDGVPNECELSGNDCNENNVPDDCEIDRDPPWNLPDCNDNGIPDSCDIADCVSDPACDDCNENNIPDECDIANEISDDENENGIPDECETESLMGGGGGSSMMSASYSEMSDDEKWDLYIAYCYDTDFSSMTHGEKFSALLAKRLELGLPAGQMIPD